MMAMKSHIILAIVIGLQLIDRMSWSQDVSITFDHIPFPADYNYCQAPLPDVDIYAPVSVSFPRR
jgi:hypothetical protein